MNTEGKNVRKPQQKRSRLMTEKIVSTALKLFCEKGYYNTTTNEIAKEAGISIGSLYSYYKDKDTIFLEILNRYHENFLTVFEKIRDDVNQALYKQDKRAWLRILLDELVDLHLSVKTLNRELKGLYYIKDEVREIMDQQSKKIQAETFELLSRNPDEIHSGNLEIMSLQIEDCISAVIDRIVFDDELSEDTKEEIITTGINGIFKILYE